jgi:hypothetical protein
MIAYFARIQRGKVVLWCYLIWYLVVVSFYFDPTPRIWLNSVGISVVIGVALVLSVSGSSGPKTDRWQTFRLFLMPFCVSSFSSLIKGNGFILIVPPKPFEQIVLAGACAGFLLLVALVKKLHEKRSIRSLSNN